MSLFEVLFKRRKFIPLHEQLWQVIAPQLAISVAPDDDPAQHRRECFFYAGVVYAGVYQAALEAGMTTSTAFSLARIQLRKCPFDSQLLDRVDALFSADEGSAERAFGDLLLETVGRIAASVLGGVQGGQSPELELQALQSMFAQCAGLEGPAPGAF